MEPWQIAIISGTVGAIGTIVIQYYAHLLTRGGEIKKIKMEKADEFIQEMTKHLNATLTEHHDFKSGRNRYLGDSDSLYKAVAIMRMYFFKEKKLETHVINILRFLAKITENQINNSSSNNELLLSVEFNEEAQKTIMKHNNEIYDAIEEMARISQKFLDH